MDPTPRIGLKWARTHRIGPKWTPKQDLRGSCWLTDGLRDLHFCLYTQVKTWELIDIWYLEKSWYIGLTNISGNRHAIHGQLKGEKCICIALGVHIPKVVVMWVFGEWQGRIWGKMQSGWMNGWRVIQVTPFLNFVETGDNQTVYQTSWRRPTNCYTVLVTTSLTFRASWRRFKLILQSCSLLSEDLIFGLRCIHFTSIKSHLPVKICL